MIILSFGIIAVVAVGFAWIILGTFMDNYDDNKILPKGKVQRGI